MREIELMKPLYCDQDIDKRSRKKGVGDEIEEINQDKLKKMLDYFNVIEKNIDDQSKDGLEETIANCKQKFDLVMNLSERVYYKNILLKIRIDKSIVDSNKKLIHDPKNKNKLRAYENKIKKERCFLWKYICCFCNDCMYHYIDKNAALEVIGNDQDIEKGKDIEKGNQKTIPLSTVINDTTYHDMGYDTPEEKEEESPKNYLDFNFIEKEFNIKKKMAPLSKLSERRKKNMFMSCGSMITPPKKNDSNNRDDSELCLNDKETTNIAIRETNNSEAIHDTDTGNDISSLLPKEKQEQNKKIKPIDGEEHL